MYAASAALSTFVVISIAWLSIGKSFPELFNIFDEAALPPDQAFNGRNSSDLTALPTESSEKNGNAKGKSENRKLLTLEPDLKAAVQSDALAQHDLGLQYKKGLGVEKNYDTAIEWFEKSSRSGNPDALIAIGDIWRDRDDGKRNFKLAKKTYQDALDAGNSEGAAKIAYLLEGGHESSGDILADAKEVIKLYTIAADANVPWAVDKLGEIYRNGDYLVDQDISRAAQLFEKSVALGHTPSYLNLAKMYLYEGGVPVDGPKAIELLSKAYNSDDDRAMTHKIHLYSQFIHETSVPISMDTCLDEYAVWQKSEEQNAGRTIYRPTIGRFELSWMQLIGMVPAPVEIEELSQRAKGVCENLVDITKGKSTRFFDKMARLHTEARRLIKIVLDKQQKEFEILVLPPVGDQFTLFPFPDMFSDQVSLKISGNSLTADDLILRNRLLRKMAEEYSKRSPQGGSDWDNEKREFAPVTRDVKTAQKYLQELKLHDAVIDGKLGVTTRESIKNFQHAYGFPLTSKLDIETWWGIQLAAQYKLVER